MHRIIAVTVAVATPLALILAARADDLATQAAALKVIRETAADICYTVEQRGQKSESQLAGDVQAKIGGVVSKFADLGVTGSGQLKNQDYRGVTQEALAASLQSSTECRLNVFNKLVKRMLPARSADTAPGKGSDNTAAQPFNLAGRWGDLYGASIVIKQQGDAIVVTSDGKSCLNTDEHTEGHGTITGNYLSTTYASNLPSRGQCSGIVMPNGMQITTECMDTVCGHVQFLVFRQQQ